MQFDLGLDDRTTALAKIHQRLLDRFGRHDRPLPDRFDPMGALVQGVIGAQTRTAISNRATQALLAHFGDWNSVASAAVEDIKPFLLDQTFPQMSADRLKACLSAIGEQRGAVTLSHIHNLPVDEAMAWLESLPGIGRKISAGVVNASTMNRPSMVIDSHHRRILQRLGLVPPKADTVRAYDAIMPLLPPDWSPMDMDEHHMLMKSLGQTYCRPSRPKCGDCPVAGTCDKVGVEPEGHARVR